MGINITDRRTGIVAKLVYMEDTRIPRTARNHHRRVCLLGKLPGVLEGIIEDESIHGNRDILRLIVYR